MDTPPEERRLFDHVTCSISASVDEVAVPGTLALDLIEQAEVEVERLDKLKSSRMKEIAFKRQAELEEIFAHLNLKRAEKARILVNKIPALVDTLVAKTRAWEEDRVISFTYHGIPLLAMLAEYAMLRQEREEEKRRTRESKKFHEQQNTEQAAIFGSRPSPARPVGQKKVVGANGTPSRRLSQSTHQNGSRTMTKEGKRESIGGTRPAAPVNYVAISKEDSVSHLSGTDPVLASS